jgi:hypothetical protein
VTIPGAIPTPTPTPTVTYVRPTNTSPPTISGDATVGSTLTATNGTWEGSEPLAYAYGWFRCDSAGAGCTGIADGTGPTYQLTPDDFGHTMEVVVTATNGGGSSSATSAPTSTVSDSTPPAQPSVSSLARVTTSSDVELAWTDVDEGARTFDVRERVADFNSGFGSFSDVVTETSSSSSTFAVAPGHTYCFSARAHDEADNASDWSSESCTTTPVDDRNLTSSTGWLRLRSSASYLGTYSAAKQRGAKLSLKGIRATRLALVAQRCSGCGRVRIYLGGKVLKDIRLDAATKKNRAIIPIIDFDSVTRGKVTIEIRSSGRPVRIDGLAVQGG